MPARLPKAHRAVTRQPNCHASPIVSTAMQNITGTNQHESRRRCWVRKKPLLDRKQRLAKLIAKVTDGIEYSDHIEGAGDRIFDAACSLGHEGIVAKRKDL